MLALKQKNKKIKLTCQIGVHMSFVLRKFANDIDGNAVEGKLFFRNLKDS